MIVKVEHSEYEEGTIIKFLFQLEDTDQRESTASNSGNNKIILGETEARFFIPETFELPHPDLCAFAALKIISPYIGLRFEMDRPVSTLFASAVKKAYPLIKEVVVNPDLESRPMPQTERPVVSFSGGADSVAAAALLGPETPLILSARTWHPNIGVFEKWYNTEANVKALAEMPNVFKKIHTRTDFEFLSTNGNYCIYPDTYAFSIPCILLADHLSISHIVTGDIWVAFNGDETIFNPKLTFRHNYLFESVGLSLEPILNGVGEFGSLIINNYYNLSNLATSCQYGSFQKPCMKCIKCFRKSLFSWALFGKPLTYEDIQKFNSSPAIKKFANNNGRGGLAFGPSYKYAFEKIGASFDGPIGLIKDRAVKLPINTCFTTKIFGPAYTIERPVFSKNALSKLTHIMNMMSDNDIDDFSKVDWREIITNTN